MCLEATEGLRFCLDGVPVGGSWAALREMGKEQGPSASTALEQALGIWNEADALVSPLRLRSHRRMPGRAGSSPSDRPEPLSALLLLGAWRD